MKSTQQLKFRRNRQRGAALVEGALTFPILCLFFSMMASFHNLHEDSYLVMNKAREIAWASASNGCDSGSDSVQAPKTPPDLKSGSKANSQPETSKGAQKMTGLIAIASGSDSKTSTSKPFALNVAGKKKITWTAYVACNELVDPQANVLKQMVALGKRMMSGIL